MPDCKAGLVLFDGIRMVVFERVSGYVRVSDIAREKKEGKFSS